MKKAKYYIYRNLHTGTFSVKYKGIVIDRPTNILANNCEFIVNEKGRQRVLNEKRKNVHAMVACSDYVVPSREPNKIAEDEVYYNPYTTDSFIFKDTKETINYATHAWLFKNKIYVQRNSPYSFYEVR